MAVAYSGSYSQLNSYRTQSVVGLNPGQLLIKTYDLALVALSAGDGDRACRVLTQLIEALDFQYDVAVGLFRLYRYCMDEVKQGNHEVPAKILRELRDTWAQAVASQA